MAIENPGQADPVGVGDAWHVGILVRDIDAAAEAIGFALGIRFRPVDEVATPRWQAGDGTYSKHSNRITYSVEGPPYIELIQGWGDGVFGLQNGEGLHHLGVWVDGPDRCRQILDRRGVAMAGRFVAPTGSSLLWFNEPATLHGLRVEYCDVLTRPRIEALLTSDAGLESLGTE